MAESKTPLPGKAVRGSKTGVPLMAALDLIGRRWTLQIIWELSARPLGFRELRSICSDISPTILNTRLKELREAQIIDYDENGKNCLSPIGRDLFLSIGALKAWSENWANRLSK